MSLVQQRERRQTAGNRLKRLLEQQEDPDDEFYGTAYGGFVDEAEDNDYHSEESEDDEVDSDFDRDEAEQEEETEQNENEKKEQNDDDEEAKQRKRKKIVYQAQSLQQELKAKKKEEREAETTSETKATRKPVETKIEAKTLRSSTSVKRVELERRQKERQERRDYLKSVASLRNTREVRRLTQEELIEEAKITEEINMASLEAYQQIEMKKKEIKRMKLIQECPRICLSSMTIVNEPKYPDHDRPWNDDQILDQSNSERCSRTFLSFTHLQTYQEAFAALNNSTGRRRRRLCPITGLPAQYFDPLTQMPYANLQAFQTLRRIYAEELKRQKRTPSVLIDQQRDVNLNILR